MTALHAPIQHYENFPVASWLCPPALRAPVAAIYHFARTADDLADEGAAPWTQRLADLQQMGDDLQAVAAHRPDSGRWPAVFGPLGRTLDSHALPVPLLADLLDAFAQDVRMTRDGASYADIAQLLDYCRRSANPVGRLLLHLYGVQQPQALVLSDHICTALQLINFWQDLSVDIARGRHYLPDAELLSHGVSRAELQTGRMTPGITRLIARQVQLARDMMHTGQPLVHWLAGRAGWELRLVVQGGLRILDKIESLRFASLQQRPRLSRLDGPGLLWRSLWM